MCQVHKIPKLLNIFTKTQLLSLKEDECNVISQTILNHNEIDLHICLYCTEHYVITNNK